MNHTEIFIGEGRFQSEETFIKDNLLIENIVGSHAFGCNKEDADFDIIGVFMDRHQDIYPQSYGLIIGYDKFEPIRDKEVKGPKNRITLPSGRACEGEWKSLIKFFELAGLGGSPHLIESLFVKRNYVTVATEIGWILRDNRRLFLSARTFHSFKGFSQGQMERLRRGYTTKKSDNPLRQGLIDQYGYDVKMASHLLRLIDEIDQMLTVGDLELMRAKEDMKTMRAGLWGDFNRLEEYYRQRIQDLEKLVSKGVVPVQPQYERLHELLNKCIEQYYGSMEKSKNTEYISAREIKKDLDFIKKKLCFLDEPPHLGAM